MGVRIAQDDALVRHVAVRRQDHTVSIDDHDAAPVEVCEHLPLAGAEEVAACCRARRAADEGKVLGVAPPSKALHRRVSVHHELLPRLKDAAVGERHWLRLLEDVGVHQVVSERVRLGSAMGAEVGVRAAVAAAGDLEELVQ